MGWGRTLLMGDVGNRLDIGDCEQAIRGLKSGLKGSYRKDVSQDQKIQTLQKENGELKLYVAALARILMAKGVVTPDELAILVDQIDAEDGNSDGGYSGDLSA